MSNTPLFSICVITKNESKTLPRLVESLSEFKNRGGSIIVLDTGSTDDTFNIAVSLGCDSFKSSIESKNPLVHHVGKDLARNINEKFIIEKEQPVLNVWDTYFDFSTARNICASLSPTDIVSFADADEIFTTLDIDGINRLITEGYTQFEYNFVFAHNQDGSEAMKFVQSKMYDKRSIKWVGLVHEYLEGAGKRVFLAENILKLEHFQNQESGRHTYLIGLAVDCFFHQDKDRNSFYFARELFWSGRLHSALKEFQRHTTMNGWPQERAQSFVFMGNIYGRLGVPLDQMRMYSEAFFVDEGTRREPLIHLAEFYLHHKKYQSAICYAVGALEIPFTAYYANQMRDYTVAPHYILYRAYGWIGKIEKAQEHLLKCLEYEPNNQVFINDKQIYFGLQDSNVYQETGIQGWMAIEELRWLHEKAKEYTNIIEIGAWKGRTSHALATGTKGELTVVDHFQGSKDVIDDTNWMAKKEDVFAQFSQNTSQLKNITVNKTSSQEAIKQYQMLQFDMVFLDAGHTYEEVKEDLLNWIPKCSGLFVGDDFIPETWMGVVKAVNEIFGKPDGVIGKVWWVDLTKRTRDSNGNLYTGEINIGYEVSSKNITGFTWTAEKSISKLIEKIENNEQFVYTKFGDGEMIAILGNGDINGGVNIDGSAYTKELGLALKESYQVLLKDKAYLTNGLELLDSEKEEHLLMKRDYEKYFLDIVPQFKDYDNNVNFNILHQQGNLSDELKLFYLSIKNSDRRKIYIGPQRLSIVSDLLKTEFIPIPEIDAFDEAISLSNTKVNQDDIVLISAGLASNVIMCLMDNCTKINLGSAFDPLVSQTRTGQITGDELKLFYSDFFYFKTPTLLNDSKPTNIPKTIYTCWLGEEMPIDIAHCIKSQKIEGYEHHLITLENYPKGIKYVEDAITAKKWVKACDYLKMWYLYENGGIFLDADVQILPNKNFDSFLDCDMFCSKEENGFLGYSCFGMSKGFQLGKDYIEEVETKFKGNDDLNFESSMEIFTNLGYGYKLSNKDVNILDPEYFFPYNHQKGTIKVTENTISFHHFWKSWLQDKSKEILPTVDILIPTLGREEGLKNCLRSINELYYPKHLINIQVLHGGETVPKKIKEGVRLTKSEYICYAANDMEFDPYCLYKAIVASVSLNKRLVSFNEGELLPDQGNICSHFVIKRSLIKELDNQEVFYTGFHHVGCDNYLWIQCFSLGESHYEKEAVIIHNHFSKTPGKWDSVYEKGWTKAALDRVLLQKKIRQLPL